MIKLNFCVTLLLLMVATKGLAVAQTPANPIRLHPENPNWFQWRDKATVLITSAEHYGAVVNLDFDYHRYLQTLEDSGLNYTRIFAGPFVEPEGAHGIDRNTLAPAKGRFLAPWARSDKPGYAGGGNKFDLEKFNPEYLRRLNDFIKTANEHGVVVELTFFSSIYRDEIWLQNPLHPENNIQGTAIADWRKIHTVNNDPAIMLIQERLVRWMVRELNDHDNLFFEIQNEPWADNHIVGEMINPYLVNKPAWPNAPEIALDSSVKWQSKISEFIRAEERRLPKKHLVAQNVANFRLSVRDSDRVDADIINFHYAYPEAVRWNLGLDRVIGYDESGFAGSKDQTYRRQAWNFVLSGGGLFNNLDYSFAVGAEDGSKPLNDSPGGGGAGLRRQLRVLSEFMHSFDLAGLKPDDNLVRHAPGVLTRVLGNKGRQYAVYIEGRSPTQLKLELPSGKWQAEWISVIDGEMVKRNEITTTDEFTLLESPSFSGEIALRILRD